MLTKEILENKRTKALSILPAMTTPIENGLVLTCKRIKNVTERKCIVITCMSLSKQKQNSFLLFNLVIVDALPASMALLSAP